VRWCEGEEKGREWAKMVGARITGILSWLVGVECLLCCFKHKKDGWDGRGDE
jgi:hypothetical protein